MRMTGRSLGFEALESRVCLTVSADVVGGNLLIGGVADGDVAITAVDVGSFQVTDNGVEIGQFSGVTKDIRIKLDANGEVTDDNVTVDLAGQSIKRLSADLGDGDNSLKLQGGTVKRGVSVVGGNGDDTVDIADDAEVGGDLSAQLREGDNSLTISGTVGRGATMSAGSGDDTLTLAEGATVDRGLVALLGDGDNSVTIAGEVGRTLKINAGEGDDTVELLATALVWRSATITLGEGDNVLSVDGEIDGNLNATSANPEDDFSVSDTALIGGDTNLSPGEQIVPGIPTRPHGDPANNGTPGGGTCVDIHVSFAATSTTLEAPPSVGTTADAGPERAVSNFANPGLGFFGFFSSPWSAFGGFRMWR